MKVLMTGATGFVGGHLLRLLCAQHEVFVLARRPPQADFLPGVHWIEQDLTRPLDRSALPLAVDVVIHLAQSRLYKQFPERAQDIFEVNIQSTFQLLEYARRASVSAFIFASSGGVYGYSYERFVETDPVSPLNFYLSSKYTAELLIANYQPFFRTVVFRFFFVYGPGQRGMLVPILLGKIKRDEVIDIEGNPGIRINPIYIADAIRIFEPALHLRASALFNVAGDEAITITDLVHLLGAVTGKEALIRHTEAHPEGDLIGDNRRMREVLGVRPETPLREGLGHMLQLDLGDR